MANKVVQCVCYIVRIYGCGYFHYVPLYFLPQIKILDETLVYIARGFFLLLLLFVVVVVVL